MNASIARTFSRRWSEEKIRRAEAYWFMQTNEFMAVQYANDHVVAAQRESKCPRPSHQ